MSPDNSPAQPSAPSKLRGLKRLMPAFSNSINGLKVAFEEPAIHLEACVLVVAVPLAFFVGQGWVETFVLMFTVALVLLVEIINTAIETVVDRIGLEWHEQSKKAKDLGSAAVFASMVICAATWLSAVYCNIQHIHG